RRPGRTPKAVGEGSWRLLRRGQAVALASHPHYHCTLGTARKRVRDVRSRKRISMYLLTHRPGPHGGHCAPRRPCHPLAGEAAISEHVLIVDDAPLTREALALLLNTEGFVVAEAGDGAEALLRLRSGRLPSLVLLDLLMPGMDGWRFLAERQRQPS